ncbi:hypothetical protein LshimejAT787_2600460 [Lyophyllum shimeji]|uniref:Uncharacterized protein n=1 Tax=Lyophyllum shimeji TaxID=47721 RepID=A0A9P3UUK4_LYOSH|nr:hypothetical protein LshimejAT787_2600460 [Lyophyllum shimeji]
MSILSRIPCGISSVRCKTTTTSILLSAAGRKPSNARLKLTAGTSTSKSRRGHRLTSGDYRRGSRGRTQSLRDQSMEQSQLNHRFSYTGGV